jgi:NitT/TauT family transport system substrate-binding protein
LINQYFVHRHFLGVLCILIASCFISCQKQSQDNNKIVYRLKWLLNSGAAGSLYANANGYFHAQGLDVTIRAGGVEKNAITEIEMRRAQFGVASGDQIIRALEKGSPICVIAQLFQKSPMCWMYYKNRNHIQSLKDLKGKTIGITFGNEDETIMRALLKKAGIQASEVQFYSVRYDYTPFYTGKVDLWPVYRNSNGIVIQEKLKSSNEEMAFFSPHDNGVQFVGNAIISSQMIASQRPELVCKFRNAIMKGWAAALDEKNLAQTIDIIQLFDETTDQKLIKKQVVSSRALMQPNDRSLLGAINMTDWKQTQQFLLDQNIISKPILSKDKTIFFQGDCHE